MTTLRLIVFVATCAGLGMPAHMLTGCTGKSSYAVRDMEAYGKLRVDKVADHSYTVTLSKREIRNLGGPNVDNPGDRLDLVRTALNCPTAEIVRTDVIPRGTLLGYPLTDYKLAVRC